MPKPKFEPLKKLEEHHKTMKEMHDLLYDHMEKAFGEEKAGNVMKNFMEKNIGLIDRLPQLGITQKEVIEGLNKFSPTPEVIEKFGAEGASDVYARLLWMLTPIKIPDGSKMDIWELNVEKLLTGTFGRPFKSREKLFNK